MSRVVVFGNASLDIVLTLAAFPQPGETVLAREALTCAGGKGLNQAIAAARAGARAHLIAGIGADDAASRIRASLAAESGLTTSFLPCASPTDLSTIWLDGAGENMIASSNSCAHAVTADDAARELADLAPGDWLVLQGNLTQAATEAAILAGRTAQAGIVLNTAPMQGWMESVLPKVDILVANDLEARQLTGAQACDEAAARLRDAGCARVVITLGARGALMLGSDGSLRVPAPAVTAIDTAGAGDMFVGALVASLARQHTMASAMALAVASAAASVTRRGTTTSFPTRDEMKALTPPS
ncbi:MAG: PfkB family carbohydrate kinase [Bosea sp. (in: a-proteobacteria)]